MTVRPGDRSTSRGTISPEPNTWYFFLFLSPCKDEDDVQDVIKKMAPCGVETIVVDLKKEIAEGAFEAEFFG